MQYLIILLKYTFKMKSIEHLIFIVLCKHIIMSGFPLWPGQIIFHFEPTKIMVVIERPMWQSDSSLHVAQLG